MRFRLAALGLLAAVGCRGGEWARDYEGYVPGAHGEDIVATLVVDDRTGRPLPGATVRLFREEIRHDREQAPFVAEFVTDEFGIFWTRWDQAYFDCHWVYDHPGYAAHDSFAEIPETVELRPGETVRGRLLDGAGRPSAGVLVEHFTGCVHSPTVRSAVTDEDGRYVLHDVEPARDFLWAPAPGAAAEYFLARLAPVPGFVYEPFRPAPGVVVTGRVLDARGRPVAGALVHGTRMERGPKVRTAADGSFRLAGVAPGEAIACAEPGVVLEQERTEPPAPAAAEPGQKATIRIRPPGDEGEYLFWIDYLETFEAELHDWVEVTTARRGPVRLSFEHPRWGPGSIVVDVDRPLVEVGPGDFPAPQPIVVIGADGVPLADRDVGMEVGGDGWPVAGTPVLVWGRRGWEEVPRVSWRLQPGARILVGHEGSMPMRRTLTGPETYVLAWSRAALELDVSPARFACVVDGELLLRDEGRLRLAGLEPGLHTVLVGARGHVGRAMRIRLGEGETRRIRVDLRPR